MAKDYRPTPHMYKWEWGGGGYKVAQSEFPYISKRAQKVDKLFSFEYKAAAAVSKTGLD